MKMRTPNPHSFINPKITASLSGIELLRLVAKDHKEAISAELLMGREPLSPTDWSMISGTPLSGLALMSGTQCRQAVRCRFSLKGSLCERPLCSNGC